MIRFVSHVVRFYVRRGMPGVVYLGTPTEMEQMELEKGVKVGQAEQL
jgi:hypothetical protein